MIRSGTLLFQEHGGHDGVGRDIGQIDALLSLQKVLRAKEASNQETTRQDDSTHHYPSHLFATPTAYVSKPLFSFVCRRTFLFQGTNTWLHKTCRTDP